VDVGGYDVKRGGGIINEKVMLKRVLSCDD